MGPYGTNIIKASEEWTIRNDLLKKTEIIPVKTPEESVSLVKGLPFERNHINLFVTCAVYYDLCKLFFKNLDCDFFLFEHEMEMEMQIACNNVTNDNCILTHRSPSSLVDQGSYRIIYANSNAEAAKRCNAGEARYCITTETAKREYGLETIKKFRKLMMKFYFGSTIEVKKYLLEADINDRH